MHDYRLAMTHIENVATTGACNGWFTADTWPEEETTAKGLTAEYPNKVQYENAPARQPVAGRISAKTLQALPRRKGLIRVGLSMFTVVTAHNRPHFVSKLGVAPASL